MGHTTPRYEPLRSDLAIRTVQQLLCLPLVEVAHKKVPFRICTFCVFFVFSSFFGLSCLPIPGGEGVSQYSDCFLIFSRFLLVFVSSPSLGGYMMIYVQKCIVYMYICICMWYSPFMKNPNVVYKKLPHKLKHNTVNNNKQTNKQINVCIYIYIYAVYVIFFGYHVLMN